MTDEPRFISLEDALFFHSEELETHQKSEMCELWWLEKRYSTAAAL